MVETKTVYFQRPGVGNTETTLAIAKARAEELGIGTVLVASTTGETGARATEVFREHKLIVVTHSTGCREPNQQELLEANRAKMKAGGAVILTCQHAFSGMGQAVRNKFGTYEVDDIIAYSVRVFGEGVKVACEIALMAADAGLVRTDEEVLAIAGTSRGADTALVLVPTNAHAFFDLRVAEVLCKPRLGL